VELSFRVMVKRARRLTALRFPPELLDALRAVGAREDLGLTEQIETAIRAYLKAKGVTVEGESPIRRAGTRRKGSARKQR
jgi:hypothetical protein